MNNRIRKRINVMLKSDAFKKMSNIQLYDFMTYECPNYKYVMKVIKISDKMKVLCYRKERYERKS